MMPAFKKSLMLSRLVAKTTEFGGVAAGNMNAKEHATVAGRSKARGWVNVSAATDASIGNIMLAVAVLEVTSVSKHTMVTRKKVSPNLPMLTVVASFWPIYLVSCESSKPLASAAPPPIKTSTPHGKCCCACSQVSRGSPGRLTEGTKKSNSAAPQAMVESLTPWRSAGLVMSGLLITSVRMRNPTNCMSWISATASSSRLNGPSAV
mmetsp:Transcript_32923/g.83572  ORF Transcript_32923/g.83572 Transcript_32923/m.83572 type:complete len:207 (+) Transcript_32923:614-1234(+)